MPYCPKCGVEVDDHVKKCPLCDFPIPDVTDENIEKEEPANYPKAENIYREELLKRKNRVFYFLLIMEITVTVVLILVKALYGYSLLNYFILSFICFIPYTFFFFGYLKLWYNVIGVFLTTVVLTYFLSRLTQSSAWFGRYALPVTLLIMGDTILNLYFYRANKSKNKFVYIPVFIIAFITVLCLGVDMLIYYRMNAVLGLRWSKIVLFINVPIIFVMLTTYHKLPEKTVETLKKKFHI